MGPVAGGIVGPVATAELAAAVSNAGGLGVLGGTGYSPRRLREEIEKVRALTNKPFGVDLLLPANYMAGVDRKTRDLRELVPNEITVGLKEILKSLEIPWIEAPVEPVVQREPGSGRSDGQMEVVIEEKVPVFASGLGSPDQWMEQLHANGIFVLSLVGNVRNALRVANSGVDAIVAQKGVVSHYGHLHQGHMVAHLSVSTRHAGKDSSNKILVGNVEESLRRGASGVSVQVNMGSRNEARMIERLGIISNEAHKQNVPLLGMIYPRGKNLSILEGDTTSGAAHAARLAFELGCDVVKTIWTGDAESFSKVCHAVPIPVLIAGGPSGSTVEETLSMVFEAIQAGGAGVCMGRQVFSNPHPERMVRALRAIVHDGCDVSEAIAISGL